MPNFFQQHGQGLGELMAGLGGLVGGVQHIRDPRKKEREEYMNLLQTNPELAQAVANNPAMLEALKKKYGQKGNGMLDFLSKMPIDPGIVEKNRIQELQVRESVSNNLNDIGNAGKQINIPNFANVDPTRLPYQLSDQEKVILEEYRNKTTGQSTTAQRQEQGTRQELLTTQLGNERAEADARTRLQAQQAEARKLMTDLAIKNKGKKVNLYAMTRAGELSPDQVALFKSVPEYEATYNDDRNAWYEDRSFNAQQEHNRLSRADALRERRNIAAERLNEASGWTLGMDMATQFVQNPSRLTELMNAPTAPPGQENLWNAAQDMKKIREAKVGEPMRKARNDFRLRYNDTWKRIKDGTIDLETGVAELNSAAQDIFGDFTGYEIPTFSYNPDTKLWGNNEAIVRVGGDPALATPEIKTLKDRGAGSTSARTAVDAMIEDGLTEAQVRQQLEAENVPAAQRGPIIEEYRRKKGR